MEEIELFVKASRYEGQQSGPYFFEDGLPQSCEICGTTDSSVQCWLEEHGEDFLGYDRRGRKLLLIFKEDWERSQRNLSYEKIFLCPDCYGKCEKIRVPELKPIASRHLNFLESIRRKQNG